MARCQCAGGSCSCMITGAGGLKVTGSGTVDSPYVVDGSPTYLEIDSANYSGVIDVTLPGATPSARVVVSLRARRDVYVTLPSGLPNGTTIELIVSHSVAAGQPQWDVELHGGIDYWVPGPTLPASDGASRTWYTCTLVDTNTWLIRPEVATISA